jgi:hypothetical protein
LRIPFGVQGSTYWAVGLNFENLELPGEFVGGEYSHKRHKKHKRFLCGSLRISAASALK